MGIIELHRDLSALDPVSWFYVEAIRLRVKLGE